MILELSNVTLVCVEGTTKEENIKNAHDTLLISSKNINFAECVLISPKNYNRNFKIKHHTISPLSWIGYNEFIVHELNNYINTDYCIIVQSDGFILNPHLWSDDFLKYDYIGHTWDFKKYPCQIKGVLPEIVSKKGIDGLNRVGNGGFSIRSKKLLKLSQSILPRCQKPEDAFICNDNYEYFVSNGVKFAPVTIADKFSKDYGDYKNDTFGFHGNKDILQQIKEIDMNAELYYNKLYNLASDINEHLPTLKRYASECEHVTEMGVRWVVSTFAFAVANPKKFVSIDIVDPRKLTQGTLHWNSHQCSDRMNSIIDYCSLTNIDYKFILGDTTKIEIEETDLLFIDTLHSYTQLKTELSLHSHKVKKYIILHDTESYKYTDEDSGRIGTNSKDKIGLLSALEEFLESNSNWKIHEIFVNCNGLTVLKRDI